MYINTETNEYNITERQIKALYPNVSFPKIFKPPMQYQVVFVSPKPTVTVIERAQEVAPIVTAKGHYEQQWQVVSAFAEYTDDEGVLHTVVDQETAALTKEQTDAAEELQKEVTQATQKRLDDFARTKTYDSILSACTYATSAIPRLQTEGQYCVTARDNTWETLYTILEEVAAGTRPMPSGYDEIEPLLPVLAWPA